MKATLATTSQSKRVAEALRLHQIVLTSASQMAVAAALAGLEFVALKKEVGHGKWEGFFDQNFGEKVGLRTAQKYMALADGLKGKALKHGAGGSFLPLLEAAPSDLTKADQERLAKAVAKATDGKALGELYQDFGIAKKPQGSGAKGGNTRTLKSTATTTPAPEVSEAEAQATLLRGKTERFTALLDEALLDKPWHAAPTAQRKKLYGLLVDLTAAVKETL